MAKWKAVGSTTVPDDAAGLQDSLQPQVTSWVLLLSVASETSRPHLSPCNPWVPQSMTAWFVGALRVLTAASALSDNPTVPIALTVVGDLSWHFLQGARRGLRGCIWLPAQHTCVRPGICALISFVHTYIMHACMHAHIMHTVWVFPYMLHICKRLHCHHD